MPLLYELREMLGEKYAAAFYVLSLFQAVLTVWMLVDAGRRRVEYYWFWLIIAFQPLGAWAYFFLYKLPDFRAGSGRGWSFSRSRVSLDELRYKADHMATLVNRLALALRLIEDGAYGEALPYLEAARKSEPDHSQILYCMALCQARLNRPEEAQPLLERLLARDPRWSNYGAWYLLIEVCRQRSDQSGTLPSCRELLRLAPILRHECLLAEHLLDQGQVLEVRELLERSLRDHDFSPGPIRRRNHRWASAARHLQKIANGLNGFWRQSARPRAARM